MSPADTEAGGAARWTGRQAGAESHQFKQRFRVSAAIRQATIGRFPVHRPALTAEPRPRPAKRPGTRPTIGLFKQSVRHDEAGARSFGSRGPDGVILAAVVLRGVAMLESPKLVPR